MNELLFQKLSLSLTQCEELRRFCKTDHEKLEECLGGEILKVYRMASDEAMEYITKLQNELFELREKARLAP